METLVKMMEVLVKIAVMMMAPGSAPVPPEARGREDPFFFFLELLPRWEKGFPSGPWPPWRRRGESVIAWLIRDDRLLISIRNSFFFGSPFGQNSKVNCAQLGVVSGWVTDREVAPRCARVRTKYA